MSKDLDVYSEESVNSTYKYVLPTVIDLLSSDEEDELDIILISSDDETDLKTDGDVNLALPTPTAATTTKVDVIVPPTAVNAFVSGNRNEDSSSVQNKGKKPKMINEIEGLKVNNDADDDGTNEKVRAALGKTESVETNCYKESKYAINCSG